MGKLDIIRIPGRFSLVIVLYIFFASEMHSQVIVVPKTPHGIMKKTGKKNSTKNSENDVSNEKKLSKNLKGEFPDVPLTEKMYSTAEEYMQGGNTIKIFQESKVELTSVTKSAYVYVPENYSPGGKWGLIVSICPSEKAYMRPDWKKVLSTEKMLFIAPHGAGNESHAFKRFLLTLDSIATMKKYYDFSDENIIVQGLSGGGTMAIFAAFARPDLFKGAIVEAMGIYLPDAASGNKNKIHISQSDHYFSQFTEEDWNFYRQKGTRWAFVTGENDFNYEAILNDDESWKQSKLQYRIFDVPGMPHTNSSGADLQKIIQWMKGAKVDGYEPRSLSPEQIKVAQEKFRKEQDKIKKIYEKQQGNQP